MPDSHPAGARGRRQPIVANGVLGMMIFVIVETMLFAGLISAFMIVKSSAVAGWPPPGQPRLPVGETAFNTLALLVSGAFLFLAGRRFQRWRPRARRPLEISILLGAFFVIFQGVEWVALLGEGLTLTSSNHGAFFYLIIGMHALHAIAALGVLGYSWWLLTQRKLNASVLGTAQVLWYFVVILWPILYVQVYL